MKQTYEVLGVTVVCKYTEQSWASVSAIIPRLSSATICKFKMYEKKIH